MEGVEGYKTPSRVCSNKRRIALGVAVEDIAFCKFVSSF